MNESEFINMIIICRITSDPPTHHNKVKVHDEFRINSPLAYYIHYNPSYYNQFGPPALYVTNTIMDLLNSIEYE